MLMSVLKGDLAINQSITLIRVFRAMKDYVMETQVLVTQRDFLRLSMQTTENTNSICSMHKLLTDQQKLLLEHDDKLVEAFGRINEMIKKSDLSPVLLEFDTPADSGEYLLREGHPVKADMTYMDIYANAKKNVYIIDNYIGLKTLCLLQSLKPGVSVTIFSDNLGHHLQAQDYADFHVEFPAIPITFLTTGGILHDRFIVLDDGEEDERIYHCGASSKDAAVKLTTAITEVTSGDMKAQLHLLIDQMKGIVFIWENFSKYVL